MVITSYNKEQLEHKGISAEEIEVQKYRLQNGAAFTAVQRACTLNDGITQLTEEEKNTLILNYETLIGNRSINRFTPASGAATRMFKHLMQDDLNTSMANNFFAHLHQFAFYPELQKKGITPQSDRKEILAKLLTPEGLNYASLPKALISFHTYKNKTKKSVIEQLDEGVKYAAQNGEVHFHFTLSPHHVALVKKEIEDYQSSFEALNQVKLFVTYSIQESNTDTVALNHNGELVKEQNGDLFFRPGGHGALIHNLNNIEQDVVFIKNIDNVVTEPNHQLVVDYKKMLGALLAQKQDTAFDMLRKLNQNNLSHDTLSELAKKAKSELNVIAEANVASLRKALNKPIRVCGMVRNEGQPGGGPFWVNNTLQIVESSQLDMQNPAVKNMVNKATHFNPVDIVCGLKDYKGNKFDLTEFVDYEAYFTASKSRNGESITVLEHPGLWNGAMANWITLFMETPIDTFAPVKSVNDLLSPKH